jgi:hypothetical protein
MKLRRSAEVCLKNGHQHRGLGVALDGLLGRGSLLNRTGILLNCSAGDRTTS